MVGFCDLSRVVLTGCVLVVVKLAELKMLQYRSSTEWLWGMQILITLRSPPIMFAKA